MKIKNKETVLQNSIIIAILALFCCFLWGSAFVSIKLGYDFLEIRNNDVYDKLLFAGTRFIISSLIVLIVCLLSGNNIRVNKSQFKKVAFLGILQTFLQYVFFYIGLANTSGTNSAILTSSATFFTVLLAHFLIKGDKLTKRKISGVSLGFLGIIILNLNGIHGFSLIGEGFIIISSLLASFASIYIKKIAGTIPIFSIAAYQLFIGGIILTLIGFIGNGGQMLSFNTQGSLVILHLSLVSALAFSLWSTLLKYNNVSKVAIYKFSAPLFGVLLSFLVLEERYLSINLIIAVVLVSIGIIIINTENTKIKN